MAVEFGVLIPTREAIMSGRPETAPLLAMAERAEAAGFDSVWIGDSITARPRHEPLTLMAAVAARTRRVRLGTGGAPARPAQPRGARPHRRHARPRRRGPRDPRGRHRRRHARPSARSSPPRACRGTAGSGRFLETLEICRALWQRDGVSFSGKHFTLDDVTVEPKPHRPGGPPIWIGGSGPTALREAARFDAWFPTGPSVEFFAEHFPRIQAAARAAGRPPDAVTGAAYVTLALDPSAAAAEQRLHELPRDVLRGAGARDPGPPGLATRGRSRAAWSGSSAGSTPAPATSRCASPAATSSPRWTRRPRACCPASSANPLPSGERGGAGVVLLRG